MINPFSIEKTHLISPFCGEVDFTAYVSVKSKNKEEKSIELSRSNSDPLRLKMKQLSSSSLKLVAINSDQWRIRDQRDEQC